MIAKLGSAARAARSLPPDSDLEDLARFGRAVGPGRCSLACYGDEARAQRKTPAAAEPGGRSLGELASYLKRLPDTRERAESELCWPIRARTAARHRADRPGTAARFGRATRTMDGRLVGGQRTGPETGSASDIRSSVRHSFVSPSMTGLYRKPLRDRAIESRGNPWSKSLDLTHTEITC